MTHTISMTLQNGTENISIRFPCGDDYLTNLLSLIHAVPDGVNPIPLVVGEVDDPEELSMLTGQTVNVDEVNYLANRMMCFFPMEMRQFKAAVAYEKATDLKTLINLTFNLDRYTLIQDISSFGAVGKAFLLNDEGGLPADIKIDDPVLVAAGKRLLESKKGIPTDHGLLFVADRPMVEVYDGQVFPECCFSGGTLVSITMEFNGKTETLYLPEDDSYIKKAIHRLGANNEQECKLTVDDFNMVNSIWVERVKDAVEAEGIQAANKMVHVLERNRIDYNLLDVLIEVSGLDTTEGIIGLVKNMEKFTFVSNLKTEDDVGEYFVENDPDFHLDTEMWPYFDFESFGEYMVARNSGVFACGGFLYVDPPAEMDEIFAEIKGEGPGQTMEMGGM